MLSALRVLLGGPRASCFEPRCQCQKPALADDCPGRWSLQVDLFYFSFVTLSSIGFGDFALGPEHDGHLELVKLLLQAIWIFFGMACFNTFMDAAADWANEVVEALTKRMYSLRAALGTVLFCNPSPFGILPRLFR